MLDRFNRICYAPDNGSGSGGGQSEKDGGAATGDFVPKADFEKFRNDHEKMKQDLEDARLEMMSPEYLEFLSSKSGKKEEPKKESAPISEDEFSKMTPKQLYERAKADAFAEAKREVDELKKSDETRTKEKVQMEIKQFADTHADFKDYQSIMHSFTFDPKFAHMSLQQLYDKAKDYVKRLSGTPSSEEKAKGNRAKGEKPGGSSGTYKREEKKVDGAQAASDAWEEVVGDAGLPGT